jgi:hypothetical protein
LIQLNKTERYVIIVILNNAVNLCLFLLILDVLCSTENFEKKLASGELLNEASNDENVINIIMDLFNIYDKKGLSVSKE